MKALPPRSRTAALVLSLACLASCSEAPVGTEARPFTMYFVPSSDAEAIATNADVLTDYVARYVSRELYGEDEGFHIESAIPNSYVAVVEAIGSGLADFAAINTYGYILLKDEKKYPAEAVLSVIRGDGETHYKGQIIARADSGIDSIEDLHGKRFAYTDSTSTGGYILPRHLLRKHGIQPSHEVLAMKHDSVVHQVYNGDVDAGATFYSPPVTEVVDGVERTRIRDARARVRTALPDVEEQVAIIAFTEETPNEPWVIRTDIYEDPAMQARVQEAVVDALKSFAQTEQGLQTLDDLYDITGITTVDDSIYDEIRAIAREVTSTASVHG